jgi:ABC-2 type transport system permease protein/capsular polysaccharide transport system permease protein
MGAFTRRSVGDFARSLAIQKRVVFALLMREALTRFGRHNIGFLWLFVEPMLFTLGVTAIWTATGMGHGSNLPIVAFAVTGYSGVLVWRNVPNRCVMAIEPNASLMYHRNVRVIDIYLARIILEEMGATISFVILTLLFSFLGWMDLPEDVFKVIIGWLMLAWFGAAFGILMGTLSEQSELIEKLWHPAAYLIFPFSGAAALVSAMPKALQDVVLTFPMVHASEYMREGFFGSKVHAIHDLTYMFVINLVMTALGLMQVRVVARKVIPQ